MELAALAAIVLFASGLTLTVADAAASSDHAEIASQLGGDDQATGDSLPDERPG